MIIIRKGFENKNTKIVNLEKSLLLESKEQDFERCASIHYNIHSQEIWAKPLISGTRTHPDDDYVLVFQYLTSVNFVKKLNKLKFFDIDYISLSNFSCRDKHFLSFINFSLPNKANNVVLRSSNLAKLKSSNSFISVIRNSSKVIKAVSFIEFCFNYRQLKRLMASFRHVEKIHLNYCKFSIPKVPDFSKALKDCQIGSLDFWGSGHPKLSNWVDGLGEFKNLVQGFASSSDLSLSLKMVYIRRCGIEQKEAEQIFAANQLNKVEVYGDN
ncbi:unnamed protein product [Moneuplotes crassus]|uniref:Uncharacterized protein n=1 Tax=Euplotes crassus TaxID=5936 RepID=A0AAD1UKH3_EUPCR|nr:unnamed protein product [Moneuplotes crassus]